jgi:hypothetical protein
VENKEIKIIEYETGKSSIHNFESDSVEEKIKFLIQLIQNLRNNNNKKSRFLDDSIENLKQFEKMS